LNNFVIEVMKLHEVRDALSILLITTLVFYSHSHSHSYQLIRQRQHTVHVLYVNSSGEHVNNLACGHYVELM